MRKTLFLFACLLYSFSVLGQGGVQLIPNDTRSPNISTGQILDFDATGLLRFKNINGQYSTPKYDSAGVTGWNTINQRIVNIKNLLGKSVVDFGAVGDGIALDMAAIVNTFNAMNTPTVVLESGKTYRINNLSTLTSLSNKTIIAHGARIMNSDTTKASFLIQNVKNLRIYGGTWGYSSKTKINGGNSQHIFQIDNSQNILIEGATINQSPEIGIAITNCMNVVVQHCIVRDTKRDGIYGRYNANVWICYNKLSQCKDDALSFHDKDNVVSGIDSEKSVLNGYGYTQASNYYAIGNQIDSCQVGISSVGGYNVNIIANTIHKTVGPGVSLLNFKNDDTYGIDKALIAFNKITDACKTTVIGGASYTNNATPGTGRAAIFIGSLGTGYQINAGETKRLKNVDIIGNTVYSSGALDFFGYMTDRLSLKINTFRNANPLPGDAAVGPVVFESVTQGSFVGNDVIDDRVTKLHAWGYGIYNSTVYSTLWNVDGYTGPNAYYIYNSTVTDELDQANRKNIPFTRGGLNVATSIDFNSIILPGFYQTFGASVVASNFPATNPAGQLAVELSGDVIVQRHTDYVSGRIYVRTKYGISGGAWSGWSYSLQAGLNLSDLSNLPGARANLGLGSIATYNSTDFLPVISSYSTVSSAYRVGSLEMQSYSLNNGWLADNIYYNGGWKYRNTGPAGAYILGGTEHQWRLSASGTAGTNSAGMNYPQMKINQDGSFGLGATMSATNGDFTGAGFHFYGSTNKTEVSGDVEVLDYTKGIILKSPNGTRWRITVSNAGVLTANSL